MRVPAYLCLLFATTIVIAEGLALGALPADTAWRSIPGSAMNSVFVPGVDDAVKRAPSSWAMIQGAWSGGVCVGNELYIWGGGHGDGAHNGLLAVNVGTGRWRRVTEPSPIWTEAMCPRGVCPAATGTCAYGGCQTGPDGRPVARHTYYLLASDGKDLYTSGGGIWEFGSGGDLGASTWTFDLEFGDWYSIDPSPVSKPHGSLVAARGRLYHMTPKGFATMDIATGAWKQPTSRAGFGGQTGVVYVPTTDRFYALGNGQAWHVARSGWGGPGQDIPNKPAIIGKKYLGLTYYPPQDLILIWNGGPTVITLNPRTNQWGSLTPSGNPGPALSTGTLGRFSYCGGRVVLLNGASQNLFYLDIPGEIPPPTNPPPTTPPPTSPPPEEPPPSPPPPVATNDWPVYAVPPGGSLDAFDGWVDGQCGKPRSSWKTYNVGPGQEFPDTTAAAKAMPSNALAVVKIHNRTSDYPVLKVNNRKCVEVVGVPDKNGRLPTVRGINMVHSYHAGEPIIPGGLIVRKMNVNGLDGGVCVGVANNQTFVAVEDSSVTQCPHHGLLTGSENPQLYVRILRSHWAKADSHLLYIDRVARADIIDNTCESPGWGHCIRSVAHYSHIEGNVASNVQLDGTVITKWNKPGATCPDPYRDENTGCSIGMHPIEAYNCSDGVVRNNTAIKWQANQAPGTILFRGRTDIAYCDVEGKTLDGKKWIPLFPTEPRFLSTKFWDEVGADLNARGNKSRFAFNILYEGNTTMTLGPRTDLAVAVVSNSNFPSQDPRNRTLVKEAVKELALDHPGSTCAQLSKFTADPEIKWLYAQVKPDAMYAVCTKGVLPEYIPRPAPPNWRERQYFTWGRGNRTLVCPKTLASCVPGGEFDLKLDNKERNFFHPPGRECFAGPGENYGTACRDKSINLINVGGARVVWDADEEGK